MLVNSSLNLVEDLKPILFHRYSMLSSSVHNFQGEIVLIVLVIDHA
jgi:hypothetical protein